MAAGVNEVATEVHLIIKQVTQILDQSWASQ
jgi:hypothetical protein